MYRWVELPDGALCCNHCDGAIKVRTDLADEEIAKGLYQDGDEVVCLEGCEEPMQISADGEQAWVSG